MKGEPVRGQKRAFLNFSPESKRISGNIRDFQKFSETWRIYKRWHKDKLWSWIRLFFIYSNTEVELWNTLHLLVYVQIEKKQ